jgi:error-prone DNA polymerase
LARIPEKDQAVYDMICRADTMGVFQIESRAQMSMLPRLKPRCYYDLVIEVAIVRPGPIQGDMVHPYLRRRAGKEPVTYANSAIRRVLHKTLGVPIFQEQAMRLAVVAAGFTPGEADQLRRAMGAWRRPGVIDGFRKKLIEGMRARGLSQKFAEQIFRQIRGFGEYGFPESHAASFAWLVYVSAWLKYYYPEAFAAALINSQPMGFYAPAQLVRDAQKHGVAVRPPDVNESRWDCTLQQEAQSGKGRAGTPLALRLGLRMIRGLSRAHAEIIEQVRAHGDFRNIEDFARRTRLSRAVIVRLAQADALASLGGSRRHALWEAMSQEQKPQSMPLFAGLEPEDDPPVPLPSSEPCDEVFRDYQTTGLSLRAHPISFYRGTLDRLGVIPAERLSATANRTPVSVAGLVLLRQRPGTAKGITFVTLEDETGTSNLVIRQPLWQKYYAITRRSPAWIARGKLECHDSVIHVVVEHLEDMAQAIAQPCHQMPNQSRDFR